MKKIVLAFAIATLVFSCDKKKPEPLTDYPTNTDSLITPESDEIAEPLPQSCYLGTVSQDSVFLMLEDNLGTLTGKMRYKNYVKDSSLGDVVGSQNGDTIKLAYTYESEGSTSESEIYLLKQGDNLVEGIGEQKTEGTKSQYANPKQIKYEGISLKPADCNGFEKNFEKK